MTTWTHATEMSEYVAHDYVVGGYVEVSWSTNDGSGTVWGDAVEVAPSFTNATEAGTSWTHATESAPTWNNQ